VAIECPGAATVRFGVRPGLRLETPRIETADRLYTVGLNAAESPPPNGDYPAARRQAIALMVAYLTAERGLTPEDAYALVAACGDLEFGGPASAVVLASVPRAVLD
jgi:acetamidase/formamidase